MHLIGKNPQIQMSLSVKSKKPRDGGFFAGGPQAGGLT
jgi:hypothetical protein